MSEIRRNFDRVQIETDRDAANDFAERKELNLSAVTPEWMARVVLQLHVETLDGLGHSGLRQRTTG